MRKLLCILCCFLTLCAFGQDGDATINKTDAKGLKQGIWKKYDEGKLVYTGQFKDNIPYGTFHYYHKNGKLKSTTEFIQGVHKVKTVIYHENEHKASEGIFIDQKKDGEWRYYANNDQLIAIERYILGKKSGLWQTFSAVNGKLLEEKHYLDNKLNGISKLYYLDGDVSLEESYINGKLNGKSTSYYPKGKVSMTGDYHNGYRIGTWDFFDMEGKIRSTVEYTEQKTATNYVYLYQKGHGQKINQDFIAYFIKTGDKTTAVMKNKNKILFDETIDQVALWADFTVFLRITPSIIAATDAIVSYKEVEDGDNDAILIKLRPRTSEEVYSEGTEAKFVKAMFNTSMPKQ